MPWKEFLHLQKRYGLPEARVVHSLLGHAAKSSDDEPDAGDPHVGVCVGAPGEQLTGATRPLETPWKAIYLCGTPLKIICRYQLLFGLISTRRLRSVNGRVESIGVNRKCRDTHSVLL